MHIIKANIHGNPNVGLIGICTDKYLLCGEKLRSKQVTEFEKALGVMYKRVKAAGTDLPGAFFAYNGKVLLVPHLLFDNELEQLEELGIAIKVIHSNVTCLGNTITATEQGAIASTEFSSQDIEEIGEALGTPVKQTDIAGLTTPGAVIVTHGKKAIIHRDASPEEVELVEETLGVTCEPATVNLGSPHLKAGIITSAKGLVVGDLSGGPEMVNIDESLGYNEIADE